MPRKVQEKSKEPKSAKVVAPKGRARKMARCEDCDQEVPATLMKLHLKFYHKPGKAAAWHQPSQKSQAKVRRGRTAGEVEGRVVRCAQCEEEVQEHVMTLHMQYYHAAVRFNNPTEWTQQKQQASQASQVQQIRHPEQAMTSQYRQQQTNQQESRQQKTFDQDFKQQMFRQQQQTGEEQQVQQQARINLVRQQMRKNRQPFQHLQQQPAGDEPLPTGAHGGLQRPHAGVQAAGRQLRQAELEHGTAAAQGAGQEPSRAEEEGQEVEVRCPRCKAQVVKGHMGLHNTFYHYQEVIDLT